MKPIKNGFNNQWRNRDLPCSWWGCEWMQLFWKITWVLNIELLFDSLILLLTEENLKCLLTQKLVHGAHPSLIHNDKRGSNLTIHQLLNGDTDCSVLKEWTQPLECIGDACFFTDDPWTQVLYKKPDLKKNHIVLFSSYETSRIGRAVEIKSREAWLLSFGGKAELIVWGDW